MEQVAEAPVRALSDQLEAEARMMERGKHRHDLRVQKARRKNEESSTPAGKRLVEAAVGKLETAITEWIASAGQRKPGRYHSMLDKMQELPARTIAELACGVVVDRITRESKLTELAGRIGSRFEDERRWQVMEERHPGAYREALQRVSKFGTYKLKRKHMETLITYLEGRDGDLAPWSVEEKVRLGRVLVDLLSESTGLIQVVRKRSGPREGNRPDFVESSETGLKWLEDAHSYEGSVRPVLGPCLETPVDWTCVLSGGFHTEGPLQRPLVNGKDKGHLRELLEADLSEVLKSVNHLQRTPWAINSGVYEVASYYWEQGIELPGLPSRLVKEMPPKPADIDSNEEARLRWREMAREVHNKNAASVSDRALAHGRMRAASECRGRSLYFVWGLDFRGRAYSQSSHLHPQGSDLDRGLLQFGVGAKVPRPSRAWDWHRIHGANVLGEDNCSFKDRIAFIESRQADWLAIAEDPYGNNQWEEADKPWQFLAWCFDYAACLKDENHQSCLPIHQDATQSCIQIMSLLTRDRQGAGATNCVPADEPADLYGAIRIEALKLLKGAAPETQAFWTPGKLSRDVVKDVVMTMLYNSPVQSRAERLNRKLWKDHDHGDWDQALAAARLVDKATRKQVRHATALQDWIREVAKVFAKQGVPIRWASPVGFPVRQFYKKRKSRRISISIGSPGRSRTVKPYIREELSQVDTARTKRGLFPNFIHSLDAAAMMATVNLAADSGIRCIATVHDSYATLAADAEKLAEVTREAYVEMFTPDYLASFKSELEGLLPDGVELPALPEYGDFDVSEVRQAGYFFS